MSPSELLSPEIKEGIKVVAILINIVHIFVSLILFNFIRGVQKQVKTPGGEMFRLVGIVHVGLIIAILLAIVFLF